MDDERKLDTPQFKKMPTNWNEALVRAQEEMAKAEHRHFERLRNHRRTMVFLWTIGGLSVSLPFLSSILRFIWSHL